MKVTPAEGRAVRDPDSMQLLPDEGREVPDDDLFWARRVRDGDVIVEEPPPPPPDPPARRSAPDAARAAPVSNKEA